MTTNQLAYQGNLIRAAELEEQRRANLEKEAELFRSHQASEALTRESNLIKDLENSAKYGLVDYNRVHPEAGNEQNDFLRTAGDIWNEFVGSILNPFKGFFKF